MRRVDRKLTETPPILLGRRAERALGLAEAHFAADYSRTRQQEFEFESELYHDSSVMSALGLLFFRKCAFCESSVDGAAAAQIMHHFRPKQEAIDAAGSVSRPHYWWLAYEWENLYLSCQRCATAAGSQFPVGAERAAPGTCGAELDAEEPQLLDPCRDDPDQHLEFRDDGIVEALSKRGAVTIVAYNLNRFDLARARLEAIEDAREARWSPPLLRDDAPYVGAVRQARERAVDDAPLGAAGLPGLFGRFGEWLRGLVRRLSLAPPDREPPLTIVERLWLRDFRGIENLSLELSTPDDKAPWTMLLGENGHSKTSVLQALALLLAGEPTRRRVVANRDDLIRDGAKEAVIVAQLRREDEPRELRIRRGGGFEASGVTRPAAIAAYGAARIPSRHRLVEFGFLRRRREPRPRVANLFDAGSSLADAEHWLLGLEQTQFDYAARALRRMLLASEGTVFERQGDHVFLVTPLGREELGRMSDGYRSMIALGADLMRFFMRWYDSMDAAQGVVLVDEISAHLHPSWQMRVVESVRAAFPGLQFVVTTHDPLCLRGLSAQREVVVMRRTQGGRVYALPREEVPPIEGLQVDELLTSEVFGLNSTIDPELEQAFDRYYALLAAAERGPAAEREIKALKEQLDARGQLGGSRRERMVVEAIDEYLAKESERPLAEMRAELREETQQHLREIWAGQED